MNSLLRSKVTLMQPYGISRSILQRCAFSQSAVSFKDEEEDEEETVPYKIYSMLSRTNRSLVQTLSTELDAKRKLWSEQDAHTEALLREYSIRSPLIAQKLDLTIQNVHLESES